MRLFKWQLLLAILLILSSTVLYLLHYAVFHDSHHIFIYLLGDIAFVPIEVLLVTLIIHKVLSVHERKSRMEKLNMVIGTFFSEVGTPLLTYFSDWDPQLNNIRKELKVTNDWNKKEFNKLSKHLQGYDYQIDMQKVNLNALRNLLTNKLDFLIRLLENPHLLEHESFTDLLLAVFHLAEELKLRENLTELPQPDRQHLNGDIKRIYVLLVKYWLDYMAHLKENFPYLFSLAMRTNPFDKEASPIVR